MRTAPTSFAIETPNGRERQAACPPSHLNPKGGGDRLRSHRVGHQPLEGEKSKGGSGRTGRFGGQATTDFRGARHPEDGRWRPAGQSAGFRSSQRHAGRADREVGECRERGSLRRTGIPRALRSETRSKGFGRKKASRGRETLKTQPNPGRQPGGMSLPDSASVEGTKPWRELSIARWARTGSVRSSKGRVS